MIYFLCKINHERLDHGHVDNYWDYITYMNNLVVAYSTYERKMRVLTWKSQRCILQILELQME